MYVETIKNRSSLSAIFLRESFRENGKVKKRTWANLSYWPRDKVDALSGGLEDGPHDIIGLAGCRAKLVATCCGPAPKGRAKWPLRLLANKVGELGLASSISPETVRQTWKSRHRSQTHAQESVAQCEFRSGFR